MHRMKKTVLILLAALVVLFAPARSEEFDYPSAVTFGSFLFDLVDIYENGGDIRRIDADAEELGDDLAFAIASNSRCLIDEHPLEWVSLGSSIQYLGQTKDDTLVAETTCVKQGSLTCVYNIHIHDSNGKAIALVTTTGIHLSN